MEETKSMRYRIKVSTSTKGLETPECTVEGIGYERAEVLAESDALVAELRERYPVKVDNAS